MTPLHAILAAFSASLFFAVADVILKKALQHASPTMAAIVTAGTQWCIFTVICFSLGAFTNLSGSALPWLIAAGVLNPVLFLFFYMLGIHRIGVARSAPLKSCSPIVSVICAFIFLGEKLSVLQYLGVALAVGGLLVITTEGLRKHSRGKDPGAPSPAESGADSTGKGKRTRRLGYLFPILAGVSTGFSAIPLKFGLTALPSPLLGAWIGSSLSVLIYPCLALTFPAGERFRIRGPAWPWLILAGSAAATAIYSLFFAIQLGQVSIVTTLYQTSPLFVLLLTALFLRQLERVTAQVVVGGLMIVIGSLLVTIR